MIHLSLFRSKRPAAPVSDRPVKLVAVLIAALALAGSLAFSGCTSCNEEKRGEKPKSLTATPTTASPKSGTPAAAPTQPTDKAAKSAAAAKKTNATAEDSDAKVYRGPSSSNPAGYTITTGFSTAKGDSVAQPSALETTHSFVTVIGPDSAPIGAFETYQGAEMHGFLLARDMRHSHYTQTSGAVADGADARKVTFAPREGGDHAMIVVFKPIGKAAQAVSTPVVFRGALPQIAGRGVKGLSLRSRIEGGDVRLTLSPAAPRVGDTITFTAQLLDNTGSEKATERLKFLAFFNEEMGGGEVATFTTAGTGQWTPKEAGTWLAVAAPSAGKTPLTFKIVVAAAEDTATDEKPAPKAAAPQKPKTPATPGGAATKETAAPSAAQ